MRLHVASSALFIGLLFPICTFSLNCSVGVFLIDGENHGVSMKCPYSNPQCVAYRVAANYGSKLRLFFCTSYDTAALECYGAQTIELCPKDDNDFPRFFPCHHYCSNASNCNTAMSGIEPYPPATEPSTGLRQCYNGVSASSAPYLGGTADICDGLCVTYTHGIGKTFGCVPRDLRIQLNASSDDSCVDLGPPGAVSVCFCTGDLCNNDFQPYPIAAQNLTCYSGFGLRGQYYGSIQTCLEDEICIGGNVHGTDIYGCMKKEACISLFSQYGISETCVWFGNRIFGVCCCGGDLCNYNATQMATGDDTLPTPNPASNDRDLRCLDGESCVQCREGGGPFVGELARPCQGACVYGEHIYFSVWRCLDADVCSELGVELGTCRSDIGAFETFCCFVNDTATTLALDTTRQSQLTTTANSQISTTESKSRCPDGWIASKTIPNKCYTAYGTLNESEWSLSACKTLNLGATLVSIANGFENSEVVDAIPGNGFIMLGLLHMSDDWNWEDGQAVNYTNWAPGEPLSGHIWSKMDRARGTWFSYTNGSPVDIACELYL